MSSAPHYRVFGTDAECLAQFDRAYRKDPYYLPSEIPLPSSVQGFCICHAKSRVPAAGFFCFPYVTAGRWLRKRLLRVTRLMLMPDTDRDDDALVSHVIRVMEDLGRRAGVHAVEAEVYARINARIFFPSTSCVVNTYNAPQWQNILVKKGFSLHGTTRCLEVSPGDFTSEPPGEGIRVRPSKSGDEHDRDRYYRLWSASGENPYDFGHSGLWYPNVFGWPRAWYSEHPYLLGRDDFILFAEKNGEALGFVHWWPNVYPLLRQEGRKGLYLSREEAGGRLGQIDEAKIFRIAIRGRAKKEREIIEKALIRGAMEIMREQYGIRTCQIGNVSREREHLQSYVCSQGGKIVHEVSLIRKPLSPWGGK